MKWIPTAIAIGVGLVVLGVPGAPPKPAEVWIEARVKTEPVGVPVSLDGKPVTGNSVRFTSMEPFGVLSAAQDP